MNIVGEIHIEGLPAFSVSISAMGAFCKACGAEQIWADDVMTDKINEAIIVAFKAINLRP